jgi:ketosteroid isomerase-like protein
LNPTAATSGAMPAGLAAARSAVHAARRSGDVAALSPRLATDFCAIDPAGAVHGTEGAGAQPIAGDDAVVTAADYGDVVLVTERHQSPALGEVVTVEVWVKGRDPGADDDWHLLVHHANVLADPAAPHSHPTPQARPADAPPPLCENPCLTVPYEPHEPAEADIIMSFQTLERAVTRNDADEWVKHMADEFVVYRTRQNRTTKAMRAQMLRDHGAINAETFVAAVEAMRLWVFGDAAVMRADHVMPGNRRPPYRATRVWVKRDGRWQMVISQQTTRAS